MNPLESLRQGLSPDPHRLTLTGCGLREWPAEVYDLADTLEVLDLSGNALDTLPEDLPRLHRLRILFCSNNRFTRLPEVLGRCPSLEMIGFKANQIREVPAAALPPRLRWLILTDNHIETLPEALGQCDRLQKLALAGNRLRALPDRLADCRQLELVRIAANQLTALPDGLLTLPRLAWLACGGNPMSLAHEAAARQHSELPEVAWSTLQLQRLLGEGASGQIHHVQGPAGQDGALKVFKGELTSDGLPGTELATWLQAGHHPSLIAVQARLTGHPQQAQGLLMPLIGAEFQPLAGPPSLASCTRDIYPDALRLSPAAVRQLASDMASALSHLHARGLVHGDFYAHNILHDAAGHARLGDFGAATLLAPLPAAQALALQRLDVRALGYLLEELLERCTEAPSPALAALRDACLSPVPQQRPSAAEVAQALRAP